MNNNTHLTYNLTAEQLTLIPKKDLKLLIHHNDIGWPDNMKPVFCPQCNSLHLQFWHSHFPEKVAEIGCTFSITKLSS